VEDTVTVRALLAFFTALPLPGAPLAEAARRVYLLPFVGLVTGLPGALILFSGALPTGVAATLALGAVLLAAGLHHADGVLDVGDALMVQGSQGRRREVLKDARVGIGGLGALFLVYAPALAALAALSGASPLRAALALLVADAAACSAMTLILLFGRPAEEGSSAVPFVRALKGGSRRYAALLLALSIPSLVALPLGWDASLAALLTAPAVVLSAIWVANRAFGGIGGDVSGATGEMTRTVLLVALSGLL
jgi:adenosylcobinamide-GDP ribazoletransferase